MHPLALAGLLALAPAPPPAPDAGLFPAELVVDLADATAPPQLDPLLVQIPRSVEMGGVVFFYEDDGIHGYELWRSDGSPLGTYLVRDVCPGQCGGDAGLVSDALAAVGSWVYFAADDGLHGTELWVTDGTALGTRLVRDIRPGPFPSRPGRYAAIGGLLYFLASDGIHGNELWRSDGTPAGTSLVTELVPGIGDAWVDGIVAGPGFLYLLVSYAGGLWRTDGTPAGTFQLTSAVPGFGASYRHPPYSVLPDGRLLFQAAVDNDSELWVSDGTVLGTHLLADLRPGIDGSYPATFLRVGNTVYFTAQTPIAPGDPQTVRGLWTSDGTAGGTVAIPLPAGVSINSYDRSLDWVGGRLFFAARDSTHGTEPWVVEGGTPRLVRDVRPGPTSGIGDNYWGFDLLFAGANSRYLFVADDGVEGPELWASDGSEAGTTRISSIVPGTGRLGIDPQSFLTAAAVFGDRLFFRRWSAAEGHELWTSDGTTAGTSHARSLAVETSAFFPVDGAWRYVGVPCAEPAGDRLVFLAELESRARIGLWGTNGTALGSEDLLAGTPDPLRRFVSHCRSIGNEVLVAATEGGSDVLRRTAGTAGTTEIIQSLPPTGEVPGIPLFVPTPTGWTGLLSGNVVTTDGTASGTSAFPLAASTYYPWQLEPFGAGVVVAGGGLYLSDGTAAGSGELVPDPGPRLDYARSPVALDDQMLFVAPRSATGDELWRSDGTPGGTRLVLDLRPGPDSAFELDIFGFDVRGWHSDLASVGSSAVFSADDGVHGTELWRTDGTAAGTTLVKDIYPGSYPSTPRDLVRVGDVVYFAAEDELHGLELWMTDGTADGTHLVRDLVPGAESSAPQELTEVKGRLYFTAWRPAWGREAFQSDGTEAATLQVADVWTGPESSSPSRFAAVRDTLYFAANDGVHGFELFKVIDATLLDVFADGFESGALGRWSSGSALLR